MPRSKTLPAELDPSARQLVTRLRRLKEHSELTMRQLAVKTGYSAKSWERYLGGASLPPREAVEVLARITGTDPVPCSRCTRSPPTPGTAAAQGPPHSSRTSSASGKGSNRPVRRLRIPDHQP